MYVLDEPSIGLHQRDNDRLIATSRACATWQQRHRGGARRGHDPRRRPLRGHGAGRGVHGGRVMAQGSYAELCANPASLTGQYLSGARTLPVPRGARPAAGAAAGRRAREDENKPKSRFSETAASQRKRASPGRAPRHLRQLQAVRVLGATGNNLGGRERRIPVGLLPPA